MQGSIFLQLLASANYATCAWAPAASVTPASNVAANATIVMANLVANLTSAEIVEYRLPGTTTTVHFLLFELLDRLAMSEAILLTHAYIRDIIGSKGDGLLPAEEDPFTYNKGRGAFIEIWSAGSQLLSWGFLEGAVVAMYNALFLRGKYRTLSFTIWDARVGMVGVGILSKGNSPLSLNRTATVEAVSHPDFPLSQLSKTYL